MFTCFNVVDSRLYLRHCIVLPTPSPVVDTVGFEEYQPKLEEGI